MTECTACVGKKAPFCFGAEHSRTWSHHGPQCSGLYIFFVGFLGSICWNDLGTGSPPPHPAEDLEGERAEEMETAWTFERTA